MTSYSADTIYTNANVITLSPSFDPAAARACAVAVKNGEILAVGSGADMAAYTGGGTRIVDLSRKTLIPGFYDAHSHVLHYALFSRAVDLSPFRNEALRTLDGIQHALRRACDTHMLHGWLIAWNCFDPNDKTEINRDTLDAVSHEAAIVVFHESLHKCMLNSRALEALSISSQTHAPKGGEIGRKADSDEPNGVLYDGMAHKLMSDKPLAGLIGIDPKSVGRASELYASKGITTANEGADHFGVYGLLEAEARGLLKTRLTLDPYMLDETMSFDSFIEECKKRRVLLQAQSLLIRQKAVKLFCDGSIQVGTAYLKRPYPGKTSRGRAGMSRTEMRSCIKKIHDAGLDVEIHCIGDAAISMALDCLYEDITAYNRKGVRPALIHAQLITERDIMRAKRLGVYLSLYPTHIYYYGDMHASTYLGKSRAARISPLGSASAAGAFFSIHDDAPSFPINPLLNVSCAAGRITAEGRVLGAKQRIAAVEALRATTLYAAAQYGDDAVTGSIEPGKRADMAVLDADPLACSAYEIRDISICATILGGSASYTGDGVNI